MLLANKNTFSPIRKGFLEWQIQCRWTSRFIYTVKQARPRSILSDPCTENSRKTKGPIVTENRAATGWGVRSGARPWGCRPWVRSPSSGGLVPQLKAYHFICLKHVQCLNAAFQKTPSFYNLKPLILFFEWISGHYWKYFMTWGKNIIFLNFQQYNASWEIKACCKH